MKQYIYLNDNTKLEIQSVISMGLQPKEVIEIKFGENETFEKLFSIYSKNSKSFKNEAIEEFSIYSEVEEESGIVEKLQGTHYGYCNLISITFQENCCAVKLEKISEYDMTISDIKKSIQQESDSTNSRVLEIENILLELLSM